MSIGGRTIMSFINDNFMLKNETAKLLYNKYAKDMPIVDYHCHISPREIYEDKRSGLAATTTSGDLSAQTAFLKRKSQEMQTPRPNSFALPRLFQSPSATRCITGHISSLKDTSATTAF